MQVLTQLPLTAVPHPELFAQVVECVEHRQFCAVLGPRFFGKSFLLEQVYAKLNELPYLRVLQTSLREVESSSSGAFRAGLAKHLAGQLNTADFVVPDFDKNDLSAVELRRWLEQVERQLNRDLVLLLDHLEAVPSDLAQNLLELLRAVYEEQQSQSQHLIVVLAGAITLARLTSGTSSPFHGIIRLLVTDFDKAASVELLNQILDSAQVHVTQNARDVLVESTQGDPSLINIIAPRCVSGGLAQANHTIHRGQVQRIIQDFLDNEAELYEPLREAVRMFEEDADLLQALLQLLRQESVSRRDLALPLTSDLDVLYLTGVVAPIESDRYRLRNAIYHEYLERHFSPGRVAHLFTMAGRWDAAINHLAASVNEGGEEYRADILAAAINSMYAAEDVKRAAYFLIRGLEAGFQIRRSAVWYQHGRDLHLIAGDGGGGTLSLAQQMALDQDSLVARAFRKADSLRATLDADCLEWVVPLSDPEGHPFGVASICFSAASNGTGMARESELQIRGYLKQAARALYEVRQRREQVTRIESQDQELARRAQQLALLHRISIETSALGNLDKVFSLILTGVTAHFGLEFNRAWLFILDRENHLLDGRMGLGPLTQEEANQAWAAFKHLSFEEYLARLVAEPEVQRTPLDKVTRAMHLGINEHSDDLFSSAVYRQQIQYHLGAATGYVPTDFARFEAEHLVVVPLMANRECWGVLACDNRFSHKSVAHAQQELVATFANQAAVAWMTHLQRKAETQRARFFETQTEIASILGESLKQEEVLTRILEEMRRVLPFDSASIQLVDWRNRRLELVAGFGFPALDALKSLHFPLGGNFPNVQVFETRTPLRFGDIQLVYPHFTQPKFQAEKVHAWMGFPLIMGDRVMGVITLDSYEHNTYTEELERFVLVFARQAARAIEHAQQFRRQQNEKELIQEIANGLSTPRKPGHIWQFILRRLTVLTRAKTCVLWLRNDEGTWFYQAPRNYRQHFERGERPLMPLTVENWIVTHEATLRVDDLTTKDLFVTDAPTLSKSTLSVLGVPIRMSNTNQVGGLIVLESPHTNSFDREDEKLVEAIAVQVTVAVNHFHFKKANQSKLKELQVLLDTAKAGTNLPLREELRLLLEQLKQRFQYHSLTIYPYDHKREEFDSPVIAGKAYPTYAGILKKGTKLWQLLHEGPPSPHFTSDSPNDSWLKGKFVERQGIQSSGLVRLMFKGQPAGLLFVNYRQHHEFDETEKARLLDSGARAARLIVDLSFLQAIVDNVQRKMGFDIVTLHVLDAATGTPSRPFVGGELKVPFHWTAVFKPKSPVAKALAGKSDYFCENPSADSVLQGPFVEQEGIKAAGYVRLEVQNRPVGVLFVNWRREHIFTHEEIRAVRLIAQHAATAIHTAQQYEELDKERRHVSAVYEAARTIVRTQPETSALLQVILDQAVSLTGAHFGTIQLAQGDALEFVAAWPLAQLERLRTEIGSMPIEGRGITTRAFRLRDAQLVRNTALTDDFVDVTQGLSHSELAVVLFQDQKPIGVLDVEHREVNGLDMRDRRTLISLAKMAEIALNNAAQYKLLEKTKDSLLASEAVAWLGLFGADWQHDISQKAFSFENYQDILRKWLEQQAPQMEIPFYVWGALDGITKVTNEIRNVQFISQVPSDPPTANVTPTLIDKGLERIITRFTRSHPEVNVFWDFQCTGLYARIPFQWLQVAMEKLVNNALKAMPDGGELLVRTRTHESDIQIAIRDTGKGIPEHARPYFLKQRIPRAASEAGSGMGSLIARFIALGFRGDLQLVSTESGKGTLLLMTLPLAAIPESEPIPPEVE